MKPAVDDFIQLPVGLRFGSRKTFWRFKEKLHLAKLSGFWSPTIGMRRKGQVPILQVSREILGRE